MLECCDDDLTSSSSKARLWSSVGSEVMVNSWSGLLARAIRLRVREARSRSRIVMLCTVSPAGVVLVFTFRLALSEVSAFCAGRTASLGRLRDRRLRTGAERDGGAGAMPRSTRGR